MKASLSILSFLLALIPAVAGAKDVHDELLQMTPETRIEQRCNGRAAGSVRREHKGFAPDKVMAYAFQDDAVQGTTVIAHGAAIRSKGRWYRLSYDCTTTPDGMAIETFTYSLGDAIPERDWEDHFLFH